MIYYWNHRRQRYGKRSLKGKWLTGNYMFGVPLYDIIEKNTEGVVNSMKKTLKLLKDDIEKRQETEKYVIDERCRDVVKDCPLTQNLNERVTLHPVQWEYLKLTVGSLVVWYNDKEF